MENEGDSIAMWDDSARPRLAQRCPLPVFDD